MTCYAYTETPLGRMLMESDGESLTGLWFTDAKYCPSPTLLAEPVVFSDTRNYLHDYFAGLNPETPPKINLKGTQFQRLVWAQLLTIPYGATITYAHLAARVARLLGTPRMAAQAIGGAVARNPVCICVPCHRVIGSDGSLTGYAGGVWRKQKLLDLERLSRPF